MADDRKSREARTCYLPWDFGERMTTCGRGEDSGATGHPSRIQREDQKTLNFTRAMIPHNWPLLDPGGPRGQRTTAVVS